MNPSDQLWFFLKEDMTLPKFTQKQYTLLDVRQNGITLQSSLSITSTKGNTENFAFYIHSASMAAAVRMLTDESIWVTYKLYCQKDPVVTILIRDANEPSPNTSHAPSHSNSYAERRKVSRGKIIPERSSRKYSFSLRFVMPLGAWTLALWRASMIFPSLRK